jgi:hypothetical protein
VAAARFRYGDEIACVDSVATEAVRVGRVLAKVIAGNMTVLLLAANSVVLFWSATRRQPSWCR